MIRARVTIGPDGTVVARRSDTGEVLASQVDLDRVRRTTEAEIARHAAEDDVERGAMPSPTRVVSAAGRG